MESNDDGDVDGQALRGGVLLLDVLEGIFFANAVIVYVQTTTSSMKSRQHSRPLLHLSISLE